MIHDDLVRLKIDDAQLNRSCEAAESTPFHVATTVVAVGEADGTVGGRNVPWTDVGVHARDLRGALTGTAAWTLGVDGVGENENCSDENGGERGAHFSHDEVVGFFSDFVLGLDFFPPLFSPLLSLFFLLLFVCASSMFFVFFRPF